MCWAFIALPSGADAIEIAFKQTTVDPKGRIDAIAYLGKGVVLAGFRGKNDTGFVFVSKDYGTTWRTVGIVTASDGSVLISAQWAGLPEP